ncbi:MAG: hypothetical protein O6952_00765, partial [Planctomycetota bacterium]|nr:hypothetical protein [Planctomycetota bacterium]
MLVPFALSLLYFDILPDHPIARVLYTGSKVFLLLWPIVSTIVIYGERIPWPDLKAPKHWRAIPLGLIVGGVIVGAMFVLMETSVGDVVRGGAGKIRD